MTRRPSGKKNPQVVRPRPVETGLTSLPSTPIVKIWSQENGGRVDWTTSRVPVQSKYASAFCPPEVSRRRLRSRRSRGSGLSTTGRP